MTEQRCVWMWCREIVPNEDDLYCTEHAVNREPMPMPADIKAKIEALAAS